MALKIRWAGIAAFALARAREPSTWRGMILLLTAAGVGIGPELAEALIPAGIGLAGLVGVVFPDVRGSAPADGSKDDHPEDTTG